MACQIIKVIKSLTTNITPVQLGCLRMEPDMFLQVRGHQEFLTTDAALVGFVPCVDIHVVLELPLVCEFHGTYLAVVHATGLLIIGTLIQLVLLLVQFEAFLFGECLEAEVASK